MENKKVIILALLIIGLVLVSGCLGKPATESKPTGAFVGGSKGLVLTFQPNAPPSEYPECTKFDVTVKVENKGESPVAVGKADIILGGIAASAFGVDNAKLQNKANLTEVQKFGKEVTPGGAEFVTFSANSGSRNLPGDSPPQKITATACYPYQTTALSTVCIKDSLAKQTTGGAELCKITGDKTVFSSGAPVQVTSVTQFPRGANPITGLTFNIKVKNAGGGTPYVGEQSEQCPSPSLSAGDRVAVSAKLVNIDDATVECTPSPVVLSSGEGFTSCNADLSKSKQFVAGKGIPGEFEDILEVKLDYGYTQGVQTQMTFQNIYPGDTCPATSA